MNLGLIVVTQGILVSDLDHESWRGDVCSRVMFFVQAFTRVRVVGAPGDHNEEPFQRVWGESKGFSHLPSPTALLQKTPSPSPCLSHCSQFSGDPKWIEWVRLWKVRDSKSGGRVCEGREPERFPFSHPHTSSSHWARLGCTNTIRTDPSQATPFPCLQTQREQRIGAVLKRFFQKLLIL